MTDAEKIKAVKELIDACKGVRSNVPISSLQAIVGYDR